MTKTLVTFFTIILLSAYTLYSQSYHFQNYSLEEGLSQSQVWNMLQDSRGSLWIGTNGGGLVRFNGNKFEIFRKKDGLPSEQIGYLFEDGYQRLWLQTFDQELVIYNGIDFESLRINGKKILKRSDLFNDPEGNTWFLGMIDGEKKISIYKHSFDSLINVSNQYEEFIEAHFSGFFMTESGLLYITTKNGIYELNNDILSKSIFNDLNTSENGFFQPVYEDTKGNLWVMRQSNKKTKSELFTYNEGIFTPIEFPVPIDPRNDYQFKFTEDSEGGFWIMNNRDKELYHWKQDPDELSFETWSNINGFPDVFVRDILEDNEGNVWLATDGD